MVIERLLGLAALALIAGAALPFAPLSDEREGLRPLLAGAGATPSMSVRIGGFFIATDFGWAGCGAFFAALPVAGPALEVASVGAGAVEMGSVFLPPPSVGGDFAGLLA